MLIEKFITYAARKKNQEYLQFSPSSGLGLKAARDAVPTLLYAHVPFCEELCPYCSFNRIVFQEGLARSYFRALRKEVDQYRDLGYEFQALYVGGGTPTVLIDELGETVEHIRSAFPVREISVETNPNHLTPEKIESLRKMGVNRLSVGVQSFDDGLLRSMERYHKYGSGKEIADRLSATQGRFQTLNVDMIFNFPMQTMEILEKDVQTLVDLKVDQVTYYPLMVSTSTRDMMDRKLGTVDYDRGRALYERIVSMLTPEYRPSTAWCFSRNQAMIDEYVVNYEEYAGLGSGSIGYLNGTAYANTFDVREYILRMEGGGLPLAAERVFSLKERLSYDFLMKLFGLALNLDDLDRRHGVHAARHLWPEILFFRVVGGLTRKGRNLSLTPKGQYYWVIMMREFFIGVNNFRDYCRGQGGGLPP